MIVLDSDAVRISDGSEQKCLGPAGTRAVAPPPAGSEHFLKLRPKRTVMAPPGFQGRHVAKVHGSKSGRSGRAVAKVAATADTYKTDRRNGVGARPEVGGARTTCAGADNTTASMAKLGGGGKTARRREAFVQGRGPAFINALEAASGL